jgi:prepilin-type processing-associated H-X9-DG protein
MLQYEAKHGAFPPAYVADADGRPMHSWRVLILPYLGQQTLYDQYDFNEPWDGPNNSRLASQMPEEFKCPTSPAAPHTNYAVLTGPGLIFDGPQSLSSIDVAKGDGLATTLLLMECHGANIHWMEPRDLDLAANSPASLHPGGMNVSFVDGSVRFLRNDLNPRAFEALTTPHGGEPLDLSELRKPGR